MARSKSFFIQLIVCVLLIIALGLTVCSKSSESGPKGAGSAQGEPSVPDTVIKARSVPDTVVESTSVPDTVVEGLDTTESEGKKTVKFLFFSCSVPDTV